MYIGLSSFFRPHYGSWCIHLPELNFTDALFKERCQAFQIAFLQTFTKTWEEILASPHCRNLKKREEREKIANDYLRLSNKEVDQIKNINSIYQIALDEEDKFRVYGIKRKFREEDYFEILFFDPNHLLHFNKKKGKYPCGKESICLMDCLGRKRDKKCSKVNEEPKNKKLIRRK